METLLGTPVLPYLQMVQIAESNGFGFRKDLIHIFAAGSHQHGARIEGVSDTDVAGVYIEEPIHCLGLQRNEHFVHSTSDQTEKNKPEDQDCKFFSLRRWAALACKGNPNVLSFLFTTPEIDACEQRDVTVWDTHIHWHRDAFLASSHASAFLGMGKSQYHRIIGTKGSGKHGQRDDVIQEFGFDTKAAMHMVRSMYEALEFLQTGRMTFPRPEVELLLAIRLGKKSLTQVEQMYLALETRVKEAEKCSPLPQQVCRERISRLVTEAYLAHWTGRGLLLPD